MGKPANTNQGAASKDIKETIISLDIIDAVYPAACKAAQMRACGLRIVADKRAIAAFNDLAAAGDSQAEMILANLLPLGHPDVLDKAAQRRPRRWWQLWP